MKTKYWIGILAGILAVSLGLSALVLLPRGSAASAEIYSGGTLLRTVSLRIDQEFTVETPQGGHNTVTVKDGIIAVTDADCPDHYCMDRGFRNSGPGIVCLPNRLVIRFVEETDVDAAVG